MTSAKKSLGQHFLRNERALADLVSAGSLSSSDTVLEIGPGEGVLTERLLATGARVVAVEKDDRLISLLELRFRDAIATGAFKLIHGDAVDARTMGRLRKALPRSFKLIANIPYYVTGLILRRYLDGTMRPSRMVLLVQREVAEEIVARDGKGSVASIAVHVYGVPSVISIVPRGSFVPMPKVDSAVLLIADIRDPFASETERSWFFRVLRSGFRSKRKTVINSLSDALGTDKSLVATALADIGVPETTRPERLSTDSWRAIANAITARRSDTT